eukprot:5045762-Prymnesium_polylepis.1
MVRWVVGLKNNCWVGWGCVVEWCGKIICGHSTGIGCGLRSKGSIGTRDRHVRQSRDSDFEIIEQSLGLAVARRSRVTLDSYIED